MNASSWEINCPQRLTRSCSIPTSFQAVTSPTRHRTGHLPSNIDLVVSRYSSSILSINHVAPLDVSDNATLQVNFAVSELPAGNLSKPKWSYDKANVPGFCVLLPVSTGLQYHKWHTWMINDTHWEIDSTSSRPFCPFRSCVTTKNTSLAQSETQTCTKKWPRGVRPAQEQPFGYTFKVYREESNKLGIGSCLNHNRSETISTPFAQAAFLKNF